VQKCAILMLQIDKQHVWLMEWASEWVTGWASEWMNEWTNGWIGWDGVDSNGWSVQRVWGNGNQCNVYADAGSRDPKIGGGRLGLEPDSDSDSGPQIAFNYVACDCAPVFMPHCWRVSVGKFLPSSINHPSDTSVPSDPSGPCFVFCVDDLRVRLIGLLYVFILRLWQLHSRQHHYCPHHRRTMELKAPRSSRNLYRTHSFGTKIFWEL